MSSIRSFALLLGASLCRAQLAAPSADVSAGPVVGLPSVVPEIPALPELPILPPLDNTNDEILPVVPEDGSPSPEVPEIGEPPLVNLPILEPPVVEIPPLEEDGREDVPVEFPIDQPVVEEPAVTEPEIDGGEVGVIIPGQDGIPEGARQGEQGAELRPLPGFQPPAGELLPLPIELPIIEEGGEGGDEDAIPPLDPLPSDAPELLDPLPSDIPELLDPLPSDAPELLDPLPSDAPEFLDPLPSDGLELLDPGQPIESTISADLAIPTDTISLPSGLPELAEPSTGQPVESDEPAVLLPTIPSNGTFPGLPSIVPSSIPPVIPSALPSDISDIIISDVLSDIPIPTSFPFEDIVSDVSTQPALSSPVRSDVLGDGTPPATLPEGPLPTDNAPTPIDSLQPIESGITPDDGGLGSGDDSPVLDELQPLPGADEPEEENDEGENDNSDVPEDRGGEDNSEDGSGESEENPEEGTGGSDNNTDGESGGSEDGDSPDNDETQDGTNSQVSSAPSPTAPSFSNGIDPIAIASLLSGSVTLQTSIIFPTGAIGVEGPASGGLAPLPTGLADDGDDENSAVRVAGRGYAIAVGLLAVFITTFVF